MTSAEVLRLTDDGERVLLRVGEQTVEVALADVHAAERRAARAQPPPDEPLTPRVIQARIRGGESAAEIAAQAGLPVATVARYESAVLAERAHHAARARAGQVDGQSVDELLTAHFGDPDTVDWDAWLVAPGRWEVRASAFGRTVRLRWEPESRRVMPIDESSRRALRLAAAEDALTAVLRPVSSIEAPPSVVRVAAVEAAPSVVLPDPPDAAAAPADAEPGEPPAAADAVVPEPVAEPPAAASVPARPARRGRAEVPQWDDISLQVSGREVGGAQTDR